MEGIGGGEKRQRFAGPCLYPGAGIRPYSRLFSLPPNARGMARRDDAWSGFRQTGPDFLRAARDQRDLTHLAKDAPRQPTRHSGIRAFAFYGCRTGPGSECPGEATRVPPGDVAVSATLAGAASRPTIMTSHEGALAGRDGLSCG